MFRSITPTLMYITPPFNAVLYHEWNKNKNNDVFTLALRPSSKVTFTCNNGWIMNIQEPTFNSTPHDVLRLQIPVQFYEHVWFSLGYLQVLNKFLIYKFYFVNFAIDFFFFIDFAHSHLSALVSSTDFMIACHSIPFLQLYRKQHRFTAKQ